MSAPFDAKQPEASFFVLSHITLLNNFAAVKIQSMKLLKKKNLKGLKASKVCGS